MKKYFLSSLLPLLFISFVSYSQSKDEKQIRDLLATQVASWNKGNINEFMHGYWENDSLMFIGKTGVTYGYTNTLNNYKKGYSDTAQMGQLKFDILQVKKISNRAFFVVGKWFLKRTVGDIGGHYTLLFRKINRKWVIVADHSS
ncbi:MAG: YybH family protein [Chitinophagaceae bacterium]